MAFSMEVINQGLKFVNAIAKYNRIIYEEVFVELCFAQDQEELDDNSTTIDMAAVGEMRSSIFSSGVADDDSDMASLGAIRGYSKGALSLRDDDSPRELPEDRRSRSAGRSMISVPIKKSKWLGRKMGRGRENEFTMRRSRTKTPPRQPRSPRRSLTPQRRESASTSRKSSTPNRDGWGKKKSEAAPPITKHRKERPATSKQLSPVISASSARAGRKPYKSKSKSKRTNKDEKKPTRESQISKIMKSTSKASTFFASRRGLKRENQDSPRTSSICSRVLIVE